MHTSWDQNHVGRTQTRRKTKWHLANIFFFFNQQCGEFFPCYSQAFNQAYAQVKLAEFYISMLPNGVFRSVSELLSSKDKLIQEDKKIMKVCAELPPNLFHVTKRQPVLKVLVASKNLNHKFTVFHQHPCCLTDKQVNPIFYTIWMKARKEVLSAFLVFLVCLF